mmetsp:Transcript_24867/g.57500  ORF Transcript_24867/g.57500 Transcript_24867/m.57500 type:complete len:222 (-) Transcript_24867:373-1038(-)
MALRCLSRFAVFSSAARRIDVCGCSSTSRDAPAFPSNVAQRSTSGRRLLATWAHPVLCSMVVSAPLLNARTTEALPPGGTSNAWRTPLYSFCRLRRKSRKLSSSKYSTIITTKRPPAPLNSPIAPSPDPPGLATPPAPDSPGLGVGAPGAPSASPGSAVTSPGCSAPSVAGTLAGCNGAAAPSCCSVADTPAVAGGAGPPAVAAGPAPVCCAGGAGRTGTE